MGALEFQLTLFQLRVSCILTMGYLNAAERIISDILFVISGVRAQTNKIGSAIISISISLAVTSRRELRNMSVSTQAHYGL
jgi:hypothetical protein